MPGNELEIVKFLISQKGKLVLPHLGKLESIKNPGPAGVRYEVSSVVGLRSDDSTKKADIYLNDSGVSIKQSGSVFLYNRLQRADALRIFRSLGMSDPTSNLSSLDQLVHKYHSSEIDRNQHWSEGFSEYDFKILLEFLMMKGSPRFGYSEHPADYILTAPLGVTASNDISFFTFEEFFKKNSDNIFITIRRQWLGQASKSEHRRCKTLVADEDNGPWVFQSIVGEPAGWLPEIQFPKEKRKTVYMLFIELIPSRRKPN